MLARREHTVFEVRQKLAQRGFDQDRSEHFITLFKQQDLISDSRFAHAYVRSRVLRGYGPRYIEQALSAKHVDSDNVAIALDSYNDWTELALETREKKFGTSLPSDYKEKSKQMRFLQQRGFAHDHIRVAMAEDD